MHLSQHRVVSLALGKRSVAERESRDVATCQNPNNGTYYVAAATATGRDPVYCTKSLSASSGVLSSSLPSPSGVDLINMSNFGDAVVECQFSLVAVRLSKLYLSSFVIFFFFFFEG